MTLILIFSKINYERGQRLASEVGRRNPTAGLVALNRFGAYMIAKGFSYLH